jgi:N-acetylneuraminic acid mutarotase
VARAAAYDPATDTWSRLAAPPLGALRYGGTGAWDGRELLVVGNASATRHDAYAYDPAANRWRRLARPPHGLVPQQAIWTGNRLIVLGGDEVTRAFAYDPKVDRWAALPRPALRGPGQDVATWTGRELIVQNSAGATAYGPSD